MADSREAAVLEAAAVEAEGNVDDFFDDADTEGLTIIHPDGLDEEDDLDTPAPNFFDSEFPPTD